MAKKLCQILALYQGQYYKALYVSQRSDGSLVIVLPSKNYQVTTAQEVPWKPGVQSLKFNHKKPLQVYQPYITYHPGSDGGQSAVHVNAYSPENTKVALAPDRRTSNLSTMLNEASFSCIAAILFPPNPDALETVAAEKSQQAHTHVFACNLNATAKSSLYIEIFVHPAIAFIDEAIFQHRRLLRLLPLHHGARAGYACTLAITTTPNAPKSVLTEPNPIIEVFVFSKDDPYHFSLKRTTVA